MTEHQATYLLVYSGLVAVAVLVEAIALGALAFATAKLMKQISELTNEAKGKVYPILESVRDITEKGQHIAEIARNVAADTEPKIKRVTTNIADTTDVYRAKLAEVDSLITDTTSKARKQSDRVDGMITGVLTRTGEVAAHVQSAIMQPVKQVSGLVSGAKAGIESLIHSFAQRPHTTPKPVAFEGDSVYTGYEDDYHA